MANLIGHKPWASCGNIVEKYDDDGKYLLLECQHRTFAEEIDGAGKVQTYTERYPWAITEHGIVQYFESEDGARKYAHEHALDLKTTFKKG